MVKGEMRFRRSPDLSKVPTEALLAELRARDLFVSAEPVGPGTAAVSNAVLKALLASTSESIANYVALVDRYGALLGSEALLRGELASERALTARLLRELGFDMTFTDEDAQLLNGSTE
jgi:hypothetical protein